jgi:hypothetical protein
MFGDQDGWRSRKKARFNLNILRIISRVRSFQPVNLNSTAFAINDMGIRVLYSGM